MLIAHIVMGELKGMSPPSRMFHWNNPTPDAEKLAISLK
jgi:hypothetical protein